MGRQKEDIGSEPLIKEIGQSRQLAKVCATSSGRHRRCTRPSTSSSTRAPEPAVGGLALATAEYERSCSETRRRCPCAPSRARCRPSSASRCWRSCPATPPTRCTSASATRRSGRVRQGEGGVPAVREAVGGDRGSRTASARPSSSIRCSTPTPTARATRRRHRHRCQRDSNSISILSIGGARSIALLGDPNVPFNPCAG
jgi:hypothetical protein